MRKQQVLLWCRKREIVVERLLISRSNSKQKPPLINWGLLRKRVGLTHVDEIQGDKERNREAYFVYAEWLSDAGNAEVRHMRKF